MTQLPISGGECGAAHGRRSLAACGQALRYWRAAAAAPGRTSALADRSLAARARLIASGVLAAAAATTATATFFRCDS